jgi:hypothetical protein
MSIARIALLSLALACLGLSPAVVLAQPSYDGLPGGDAQLAQQVRALTARVLALEARLAALEGQSAGPAAAGTFGLTQPRAGNAGASLGPCAVLQKKLEAMLDGHHFADPGNPVVIYWKLKKSSDWPDCLDLLEQFTAGMNTLLENHKELTADQARNFATLAKWGRGRVFYRTGLRMDQKNCLPADFAASLVP